MAKTIFSKHICDGCHKPAIRGKDFLYDLAIYKFMMVYANNRKELEPLVAEPIHIFCKYCIMEEKAKKLAFRNNKNTKNKEGRTIIIPTCCSCGKVIEKERDTFWSICLTKCDIKESVGAVQPVDGYDLICYCEECGNNRDLYHDLHDCEISILTREAFTEVIEPKGTFIPSDMVFCKNCGSQLNRNTKDTEKPKC